MTTEELKDLIIEKQDNLLRLLKAPRYYEFLDYEFLDTVLRLAKELDALKHQLKESELAPVENVSDYLNECIEKAAPNLSKIKDVDKELAEIRGEQNCDNCFYKNIKHRYNPCDICSDFDKWEAKTE